MLFTVLYCYLFSSTHYTSIPQPSDSWYTSVLLSAWPGLPSCAAAGSWGPVCGCWMWGESWKLPEPDLSENMQLKAYRPLLWSSPLSRSVSEPHSPAERQRENSHNLRRYTQNHSPTIQCILKLKKINGKSFNLVIWNIFYIYKYIKCFYI